MLILIITLSLIQVSSIKGQGDIRSNNINSPALFGSPNNGLVISAATNNNEYQLGQNIILTVILKSIDENGTHILSSGPKNTFNIDYKIVLFDSDGRHANQTDKYLKLEKSDNTTPPIIPSRFGTIIRPGDEVKDMFTINDWFEINREGIYSIIVMRKLDSWEDGFAISNLVSFKVVNQ